MAYFHKFVLKNIFYKTLCFEKITLAIVFMRFWTKTTLVTVLVLVDDASFHLDGKTHKHKIRICATKPLYRQILIAKKNR